jgi:hypothetical protein
MGVKPSAVTAVFAVSTALKKPTVHSLGQGCGAAAPCTIIKQNLRSSSFDIDVDAYLSEFDRQTRPLRESPPPRKDCWSEDCTSTSDLLDATTLDLLRLEDTLNSWKRAQCLNVTHALLSTHLQPGDLASIVASFAFEDYTGLAVLCASANQAVI